MKKIIALDKKKHKELGWVKPDNYMFASKDNSIGLTTFELSKAMMTFPIAFLQSGNSFSPIAILGLREGENLFVDEDGEWIFGYIPVLLRTYPIILMPQPSGETGLGFIENSGLISGENGMLSFFSKNGEFSKELSEIINIGQVAHNSKFDSFLIGEALAKYELCEKWPLIANLRDEKIEITGLWRINQKSLKSLDPTALSELNKLNALTVIFSQLFSMQNLQLFQKLIKYRNLRKNRKEKMIKQKEDQGIDLSFLNEGESINFDNLD